MGASHATPLSASALLMELPEVLQETPSHVYLCDFQMQTVHERRIAS